MSSGYGGCGYVAGGVLTDHRSLVKMAGMTVIEDVRHVLQDFISPELRALSVRMDSLEKDSFK